MVTLLGGVSLDEMWYFFVRKCGRLDNVCTSVKNVVVWVKCGVFVKNVVG